MEHTDKTTSSNLKAIKLLGQGFVIKEIAAKMRVSPKTIEYHLAYWKSVFRCSNIKLAVIASHLTRA